VDLIFRLVRFIDLERCVSLLRGHLAYPSEVLDQLPPVWRRLLREDALNFIVIEDRARRAPTRIVAFGASVFVTDAFMREARAATEPYLTARLIRRELRPGSPILREADIRKASAAGGLNLFVLHYGEAANLLGEDELRQVRYLMMEAFLWDHCGYRIKEVLQELWDEIDPAYVRPGWGRVRTEYREYYAGRGLPLPPAGQGPVLIGLTREEVQANPGTSIMGSLFAYTPPRFGFRRGEQQLLKRALLGELDPEVARMLRIAPATVKSRWRAIYDRVGTSAAGLLPDSDGAMDARGKEKRRRVLEYLRHHLEELRPFAPATRSGS